ncbi:MAG: hypothetical protein ACOCXH_04925 [Cyclobacteriaceae bacterium]
MGQNLLHILSFAVILSCNSMVATNDQPQQTFNPSNEFADYWWSGKAEVSSYHLQQARYGQIHEGNAVLIFVAEDFSKSKHVKLDNPKSAGEDAVNVMKLNFTKNFNTGIYPYSMMLSSFKPVQVNELPQALKVTATSQEWCGHTFTQLDLKGNQYQGHLYSYFEAEGSESEITINNDLLEDEIWNTIRLDYNLLPTGKVRVIPGLLSQRLIHSDLKAMDAEADLRQENDSTMAYQLTYDNPQRILKIFFESTFPFKITGWEDTHLSAGEMLTTKASLNKTLNLDYWNQNNLEDTHYRQQLGLD